MATRPVTVFSLQHSVLAAGLVAASVVLRPEVLPRVEVCWFRGVTGLPCAGCGLTHAFCAIGHGGFAAAWGYNPFGFVFYGIALVFLAGPAIKRVIPRIEDYVCRRWVVLAGAGGLFAAMLAFGLVRIASILSK